MAIKGVVIDPGHGGTDPGAISNGLKEKDFTLLISKYMYDRLKELGVPVRLTRDSDITLTPKERVDKVQSFFGDSKDVVVISNHLNAGGGEVTLTIKDISSLVIFKFAILPILNFGSFNFFYENLVQIV